MDIKYIYFLKYVYLLTTDCVSDTEVRRLPLLSNFLTLFEIYTGFGRSSWLIKMLCYRLIKDIVFQKSAQLITFKSLECMFPHALHLHSFTNCPEAIS